MKYFVHGIAFSLLFTVLAITWIFGFSLLILLGSFIGLIIGLILLMLIIGFVNNLITTFLWFSVKWGTWDILFHGFVLFIALLFVNSVFITLPSLAFPGAITTVVTVIVGAFVDGFVCKKVAGWWEQEVPEDIPEEVLAEWKDKNL